MLLFILTTSDTFVWERGRAIILQRPKKNWVNETILFSERRDIQKYSEWRQLWYPNFEDYSRAEAMAGAENNTVTNVTVQLGATAYLHCHVRNAGDRALAGAEVSINLIIFNLCAHK